MDEESLFEPRRLQHRELPWWLRAVTPTAWLLWPMVAALALGAVLPLIALLKNAIN
jgi:hypothetical protein